MNKSGVYFVKRKGKPIKVGYRGGIVSPMSWATNTDINKDSVYTVLQPKELVIPRKYSELVLRFLKKKHISFGNIKN